MSEYYKYYKYKSKYLNLIGGAFADTPPDVDTLPDNDTQRPNFPSLSSTSSVNTSVHLEKNSLMYMQGTIIKKTLSPTELSNYKLLFSPTDNQKFKALGYEILNDENQTKIGNMLDWYNKILSNEKSTYSQTAELVKLDQLLQLIKDQNEDHAIPIENMIDTLLQIIFYVKFIIQRLVNVPTELTSEELTPS